MKQSAPHPDDDLLVQELLSDDHEAWKDFLAKYHCYLKFTLRKTGIPQHDLDEAMDKLLFKVVLTIENYNHHKASLKTWLHKVARNFAIDWLRSKDFKDRQCLVSLEAKEDEQSGYAESRGKKFLSPRSNMDANRSVMQILKENFSERQIELIMLKHHDDRSWKEIGEELVPKYYPSIAAAKMDAKRMTDKLRTLLQEYVR